MEGPNKDGGVPEEARKIDAGIAKGSRETAPEAGNIDDQLQEAREEHVGDCMDCRPVQERSANECCGEMALWTAPLRCAVLRENPPGVCVVWDSSLDATSTPSSRLFLRPLGSNAVQDKASTVAIFQSSPFQRFVLLCMAMTRVVGRTQGSEPVYAFMTPPSSTAHCLHDGRPSSSFWGRSRMFAHHLHCTCKNAFAPKCPASRGVRPHARCSATNQPAPFSVPSFKILGSNGAGRMQLLDRRSIS